jgi:predicted nuclease of predicted toxin-antitoxin system
VADSIRFYLDEHVSRAVALGLRRRGIDVVRAAEAGLMEAPDEEHFAFAVGEKRVLVTQDADFIEMHNRGQHHYGIAFWEQGTKSTGEVVAGLDLIYQVLEPDEMIDHVEYL